MASPFSLLTKVRFAVSPLGQLLAPAVSIVFPPPFALIPPPLDVGPLDCRRSGSKRPVRFRAQAV